LKRITAILLLLALLLSGCGGGSVYVPTGDGLFQGETTQPTTRPQKPQTQSLTLGYYPEKSMNPYEATEISHKLIFSLVYQGLFAVDRSYQASPILCKSFSVSKDMRTYVFYPAEATFFDGSPVTAADIAASLEAARAGTVYSGRLKEVASVSVTEDGGVEVVMKIPYENLPLLLDVPIVKAAEIGAERPTGSGPYGYDMGLSGLQLKRCGSWWCSTNLAVTAPYISLLEVDSPATMRDDFEYGNISIVCADPGSDTYVDYRCDYELWDVESGIFLYLACNKNSKVFSNKAIRVALTHGIDRDALVKDYYRGFAMSAYLPASPDSPHYSASAEETYGLNKGLFAQTVTDAALEDMAITLLVNKADSRRVKVANGVAKMLADYGFTVTVSALSGNSYTNALKNGKFDLHLGQTKLSANMDLSAFFDPDGALSLGGLADTAAFALAQGAMENEGNYEHLYKRVMTNGMLCPILFRTYAIYVQRGLFDDLTPAKDNIFYYDLGRTLESAKLQ
jgi:ABC-type transport system substrate-binding protein